MIEIPESMTLAKQLRETIQGKTITYVKAAHSHHGFAWYAGDPALYPDILLGKIVSEVRSTAGFVEIMAGDSQIFLHDGIRIC